ncbi:hypothetical protein HJC99_03115 [Candidatus Saccharibacteria bacterium]|nr:hypothetical protein [Candidatus Saccharibacteria bacterium]
MTPTSTVVASPATGTIDVVSYHGVTADIDEILWRMNGHKPAEGYVPADECTLAVRLTVEFGAQQRRLTSLMSCPFPALPEHGADAALTITRPFGHHVTYVSEVVRQENIDTWQAIFGDVSVARIKFYGPNLETGWCAIITWGE